MDLIQSLEDSALLSCPGPEQFSPDWGSDEEDGAVEQSQACNRWAGAVEEQKQREEQLTSDHRQNQQPEPEKNVNFLLK